MNNTNQQPYLTLHIEASDKPFRWLIAKDGVVIHRIEHINRFAKHIGYPDVNQSGVDGNGNITNHTVSAEHQDFISNKCTQTKIAAYLFEHCEKFRAEYADYYTEVSQSCKSHKQTASNDCTNCVLVCA